MKKKGNDTSGIKHLDSLFPHPSPKGGQLSLSLAFFPQDWMKLLIMVKSWKFTSFYSRNSRLPVHDNKGMNIWSIQIAPVCNCSQFLLIPLTTCNTNTTFLSSHWKIMHFS